MTPEDMYFEMEEDALNESEGNEEKAIELLKNPKWIKDVAHDIAKRYNLNEEEALECLIKSTK